MYTSGSRIGFQTKTNIKLKINNFLFRLLHMKIEEKLCREEGAVKEKKDKIEKKNWKMKKDKNDGLRTSSYSQICWIKLKENILFSSPSSLSATICHHLSNLLFIFNRI